MPTVLSLDPSAAGSRHLLRPRRRARHHRSAARSRSPALAQPLRARRHALRGRHPAAPAGAPSLGGRPGRAGRVPLQRIRADGGHAGMDERRIRLRRLCGAAPSWTTTGRPTCAAWRSTVSAAALSPISPPSRSSAVRPMTGRASPSNTSSASGRSRPWSKSDCCRSASCRSARSWCSARRAACRRRRTIRAPAPPRRRRTPAFPPRSTRCCARRGSPISSR